MRELWNRWWPADEDGLAVAVHMLLLASFTMPMCVVVKQFLAPALFGYFGWSCAYITMPFP